MTRAAVIEPLHDAHVMAWLLQVDDETRDRRWRAMSPEERLAVPSEVSSACVRSVRLLSPHITASIERARRKPGPAPSLPLKVTTMQNDTQDTRWPQQEPPFGLIEAEDSVSQAATVPASTASTASPASSKVVKLKLADRPLPAGQTVLELLRSDLPEPVTLCDPWISEGLNIVVGRPKLGKTTMERQKLAAVADGGSFWGSPCAPCGCLFLSLEEGPRLAKKKWLKSGFPESALDKIDCFYEWPRGREGVEQLARYLREHPATLFTVIDTLSKFRSIPDARANAFQADYETISDLHNVMKDLPGRAVDMIHHTRKMKSEDPVDDISGTYGLSAAVDSYMILRPHDDGAILHIGGRLWDRDVNQYKLSRGQNRWELVGEHSGLTRDQETTLDMLKSEGTLTANTLKDRLGIGRQAAWERLTSLHAKGACNKEGGIFYAK